MKRSNLARAVTPVPTVTPATPPEVRRGSPRLATEAPKRAAPPSPAAGAAQRTLLLVLLAAPLVAVNVVGAPYYTAALAERVRHPLHAWLRPSGYVGQSAGILAFVIFVFLWLYPLRKKFRSLAWTGSVGRWLDVHVTSALALPLMLAIHAAWRSDGVIGLGLISMLVVCASGVVGRYLYTRIPRARSGVELTREEVAAQRSELIEELASTTGLASVDVERALDVAPASDGKENALKVLVLLMTSDLLRWRRTRALRKRWSALAPDSRPLSRTALSNAVRLAQREISLTQQSRMLDATHRVFRYWHVAHRPFAVTALVAVVIHITVVVAVGATWFR